MKPRTDCLTITGPWQRWADKFVYYVMHADRCLRETASLEDARVWAKTHGREQIGNADAEIVEKLNSPGLF